MPENNVNPRKASSEQIPAYQRIQRSILDEIGQGRLRPGDMVPSERELSRTFEVSLMTARHALEVLSRQGIVERRRGAGTFVAPPTIHYNQLLSTHELLGGRGLEVRTKVVCAREVEPQPEIASRLKVPPDTRLLKLERLRLVGAAPLALETSFLPSEEFADLKSLRSGSLFAALENEHGLEIAYADEEVDAATADPRVAQFLEIAEGAPVLHIRQVIYAKTGRPILYAFGYYRSDRHTLLLRRFRRQ